MFLKFQRKNIYVSSLPCVQPSTNHITNARNTASLQFQPVLQKSTFDQLPDLHFFGQLHLQKLEFFPQILIPFMKKLDKNSNFWPFLCDCNLKIITMQMYRVFRPGFKIKSWENWKKFSLFQNCSIFSLLFFNINYFQNATIICHLRQEMTTRGLTNQKNVFSMN